MKAPATSLFAVLAWCASLSAGEAATTNGTLFAFHLDFNISTLNRAAVIRTLDHVARQGYNAVLWEIENAVRFDCCPEAASPDAFAKEEFRGLLAEARRRGLEPIPLMQTFGHGEYVLSHERFRTMRERADRKDCYCSSNPAVRVFLKELLHEYLGLFGPDVKRFHLGGDEAWVYRSCPACKAREPTELYVEHLTAVAQELRAKGIRPGVWHDMLRQFDTTGANFAALPKDFALWFWDYGTFADGAWARGQETALRRELANGRDVIYCGAVRSFIDSPFLVRYGFHRANLAESIDWTRRERLTGYCVTSWAIHQGPIELQYPLIDFAARRYLRPGTDAASDWRAVIADYFGPSVPSDTLDAMTDWDMSLRGADARYGPYKDGVLPPSGGIVERLADWKAGDAERAVALLRGYSDKGRQAQAVLERALKEKDSPFLRLAREAVGLKVAYQDMMADALSGRKADARPFPRTCALGFYRHELGEHSAWMAVERITRLYER